MLHDRLRLTRARPLVPRIELYPREPHEQRGGICRHDRGDDQGVEVGEADCMWREYGGPG